MHMYPKAFLLETMYIFKPLALLSAFTITRVFARVNDFFVFYKIVFA